MFNKIRKFSFFIFFQFKHPIYPYKKKRKTRASKAREKGLEPLAQQLSKQNDNDNIKALAEAYLNEEVPNIEEALQGARDIIAEQVNEDQLARDVVRTAFKKEAVIKSKLVKTKEKEAAKYQDYFDFEERLSKCPSHRLLAIRRGEEEGFLRVIISPDDEDTVYRLEQKFVKGFGESSDQVKQAISDAYKR